MLLSLPIYATEFWQCLCGVWVPPAFVGVCPCGEMHPELATEFEDDDNG